MADLINFVSKTDLDAKKEERRQAREGILKRAKDDFDREQRRKERKKETGESTWMLPSLSGRFEQDTDSSAKDKSDKKKHKKMKKQKKNKKEKKHKKQQKDTSQDPPSSESEAEDEWVEKGTTTSRTDPATSASNANQVQRDSWMLCPPIASFEPVVVEKEDIEENKEKVEEDMKELSSMDRPGQHSRELNPYWKDGGSGLPSERGVTSKAVETKGMQNSLDSKWLKKAYQRAKEQAEEEGRSVADVVSERWGSLERLETMIEEAQEREAKQRTEAPRTTGKDRYRGGNDEQDDRRRHRDERRENERRSFRDDRDSRERSTSSSYRSRRQTDEDRWEKRLKRDDGERERPKNDAQKFMRPGDSDDRSSFAGKFMRPPSSTSTSTSSTWDRFDSNVESKRQAAPPAQRPGSKSSGGWRKKIAADVEAEATSKTAKSTEMAEEVQSDSSSSSSEAEDAEEERQEKETIPARKITEKELNEIGAKIVKAEIMGNEDLAARLKSELDEMRKNKELQEAQAKESGKDENSEEVVILTRTDAAGNVRPLEMPSRAEPRGGRKKRQKVETHGKEGKRERYFADDDRYDLKEMVRRERMSTAEDHNAMLARLSSKSSTTANSEDFMLDDHFVSSAANKISPAQLEERERQKAIKEHRMLAAQLAKCHFCFENPDVAKHLIIAIGIKVYLAVPLHESLTEGHCLIIPMQHCSASTLVDEDVWSEIQIYKKGLTKMFEEMEEDVVFLETCKQLKKQHHLIIECIPLPKETGDMAPIYFKKAILESDAEWAQNKKLIDTRKKTIRASIPRGLPYFSVEFGLDGGFAHVIEEEELFPHYFGKEIVGGMLDLEPYRWRKPRRENFEQHKKKVLQFAEWWKPFDWTRKLERKKS